MIRLGKYRPKASGEARASPGKVHPDMKNLDQNQDMHVKRGLNAMTIAIVVFFLTRVKYPSPKLFLRNPAGYIALIFNASGIVMSNFLRSAGLPFSEWQTSVREFEGGMTNRLHGIAFHVFRTVHKTKSREISLLHLVGEKCSHPALRAWMEATQSGSWSGQTGQPFDKLCELKNEKQKERNVSQHLMSSLHFTKHHAALQHVSSNWRSCFEPPREFDEGIRKSFIYEVEVLVEFFVQNVGTDLMTPTTHNNLFHTGIPHKLSGTNLYESRPWEWEERVAHGVSRGERAKAESWEHCVKRHLRGLYFPIGR